MVIETKYCDYCEHIVRLTEDGYCVKCGKHADNMPPIKGWDPDDQYDEENDINDE